VKKILQVFLIYMLAGQFLSCSRYASVQNETSYLTIKHQDYDRSYLIHLPKNYDSKKQYPIVFVLHGITSRAKAIAGFSNFNEQSDQKDFIVCYPQGYKRSWGIQIDVGPAPRKEIDDVAFFSKLIDTLTLDYSVDTNKIFACGISNGGFMTALLASKLPNQFAGIALVCSNLFNPLAVYSSGGPEIPLLLIGATKDPLLQYDGGKVKGKNKYSTIGFRSTVDFWVDKNNCLYPKDSLIMEDDPTDNTTVIKYFSDSKLEQNRVVHYKIIGGGHAWPGRDRDFKSIFLGKISAEIDAAEIITDFFLGGKESIK
jgi:polyhydroxybutyrate depolymerase